MMFFVLDEKAKRIRFRNSFLDDSYPLLDVIDIYQSNEAVKKQRYSVQRNIAEDPEIEEEDENDFISGRIMSQFL